MMVLGYSYFALLPLGSLWSGLESDKMNVANGAENNAMIDRRWNALTRSCKGSWSGTIGWIDIEAVNDETIPDDVTSPFSLADESILSMLRPIPRAENHKQNMRLSFSPRTSNPNIADWIVYHARAPNVRQEAILYKHKEEDPMANVGPKQIFYCFKDGNLGRSGSDFTQLPVIEHGYWDDDEGMRRSVVLAYDMKSGRISKICFLQQKRLMNDIDFDVKGSNLEDCSIMPENALTWEELRSQWNKHSTGDMETLDCVSGEYTSIEDQSEDICKMELENFLSDSSDGEILKIALPNGVVLVCPCVVKSAESFQVFMGYKRQCGDIQMTEYNFDEYLMLQKVTARCFTVS